MMSFQPKHLKQLVILSGKGGTGKTSLTAALAHLTAKSSIKCVLVDADVDAANLALVTGANPLERHNFISSKLAWIDPEKCAICNECYEVCRYNAIQKPVENFNSYKVIDLLCEGCASCFYSCPELAVKMFEQQDGQWFYSSSTYGPLFHAELFPAAENSGKLVTLIRQQAVRLAENDHGYPLIIIDGPPGIGCPVIASSTGVDLALLVAEPGVAGSHDLERISKTLDHFRIPKVLCINKSDIYPGGTKKIRKFAVENQIKILGEIPFDISIPQAMTMAEPVTEFSPRSPSAVALHRLWVNLQQKLFGAET